MVRQVIDIVPSNWDYFGPQLYERADGSFTENPYEEYMAIFEVAVTKTEKDKNPEFLLSPVAVIADTKDEAILRAALMYIDATEGESAAKLQVIVRPFEGK